MGALLSLRGQFRGVHLITEKDQGGEPWSPAVMISGIQTCISKLLNHHSSSKPAQSCLGVTGMLAPTQLLSAKGGYTLDSL